MSFSRPGAIDLSALARPAPPAAQAAADGGDAVYAVDVTAANFQDVVQSSVQHLVVLGLWSPRSEQSVEFARVLRDASRAYAGAIQVAFVDVDSSPEIAQALGVQGVPVTIGLVGGRPVPLFQGTVPADEVRRYFDELHQLGVQNGLTGRAQPGDTVLAGEAAPAAEEPAEDPRFAAADAAWAEGDFDTAIAEYEKLLAQAPADTEVAERLAGVRLMARVAGADLQEARRAAADAPDDLDAQLLVADLDVSGGHVDDAFSRLIDLVRRTAGDDRDRVRGRLLDLFVVVGAADPRVATARRALATALY